MGKDANKTKEQLLKENEQLRSEVAELEKSELKCRIWLENSPVCTKIVDIDYNLQYMSSSGVREHKIDDITEFYGKPYPFHFYPDSFKITMSENLKRAKETGETITQEAPIVDIKGNTLWYHSTIVPVYNDKGHFDYFLVVSLETTARKLAEEALHKYENIVSSSTDMMAFLDKQYTYLAASKAYVKAFDLTTEKIIGKTVVKVFGKKFFNTLIQPHADRCLGGEVVNYQDWFDFLSTGKQFMDIHYYPYYDDDKQISGFVVNGRNITERKLTEEELSKYREHLEILVKERTVEVDEKNKKLSDQIKVFVGRETKIGNLQEQLKTLKGE